MGSQERTEKDGIQLKVREQVLLEEGGQRQTTRLQAVKDDVGAVD